MAAKELMCWLLLQMFEIKKDNRQVKKEKKAIKKELVAATETASEATEAADAKASEANEALEAAQAELAKAAEDHAAALAAAQTTADEQLNSYAEQANTEVEKQVRGAHAVDVWWCGGAPSCTTSLLCPHAPPDAPARFSSWMPATSTHVACNSRYLGIYHDDA